MILHTGGSACGATSTRSRSSARAWFSASRVSTTPICWPSAPTRRTCGDRILSLILGSVETPHHPFVEKGTGFAGHGLERPVADLDREASVEHDPQLVAQPMVVGAGVAPRHDRDEPRRCRLVQGVGLRSAPGTVDDHRATGSGSAPSTRAISI